MLNKKGQIVWMIVIGIVVIAGFIIFMNVYKSDDSTTDTSGSNGNAIVAPVTGGNVIEMTADGFSPGELTIKKGESVTWMNKDSVKHWPASASHPTHTKYAGGSYDEEGSYAGSLACKSAGVPKDGTFDPCNGIEPGKSWTFTFNQVGTWGFHDHLVSGKFGKIIVTE